MFQNVLPSDDDLRLTTQCKIFTPAWANLRIQRPRGGQTSHQRKSKHRETLMKCSQQSLNLCFTSFSIVLRRDNTAAMLFVMLVKALFLNQHAAELGKIHLEKKTSETRRKNIWKEALEITLSRSKLYQQSNAMCERTKRQMLKKTCSNFSQPT